MAHFQLSIGELLAAYLFASEDDTRFVLNGVLVELRPDANPLLIAVDGRRLCAISTQISQDKIEAPDEVILSPILIDGIKAVCRSKTAQLQFEVRDKVVEASEVGGDWILTFKENGIIEGTYPKWRDACPEKKSEQVSSMGMNAEYLADFVKAAKFLGVEPNVMLYFTDRAGAFNVEIPNKPNFYALIMPLKNEEEKSCWQPEFLGLGNNGK